MNSIKLTNMGLTNIRLVGARRTLRVVIFALVVLALGALGAVDTKITAQQKFTKVYPASGSSRLQVSNLTGSITVEAWNKESYKITANCEAPAARLSPEVGSSGLIINVMRSNPERTDIGDVNFHVYVPVNSAVDVETKRGNITIRGVHGAMVRARVTLDGDIELTEVKSSWVLAQNTLGNIFFDGELIPDGKYNLSAMQGDININLPQNSAFHLMAFAPRTRNIDLGSFAQSFTFLSDKRRVVGQVGNGRAAMILINQRGQILFRNK